MVNALKKNGKESLKNLYKVVVKYDKKFYFKIRLK